MKRMRIRTTEGFEYTDKGKIQGSFIVMRPTRVKELKLVGSWKRMSIFGFKFGQRYFNDALSGLKFRWVTQFAKPNSKVIIPEHLIKSLEVLQ